MAAVYRLSNGNPLTDGLQGCRICDEAMQAAKYWADELGEDVQLADDDGEWIVHPAIAGVRDPADEI